MMSQYLLTSLIFLPVIAALALLVVPKNFQSYYKWIALGVSLVQLLILAGVFSQFDPVGAGFQLEERARWIDLSLGTGRLTVEYFVAIDGLSFPLVSLAVFVLLIAVLSSWTLTDRPKGYFVLLLILNGAVIGSFCALDLLLFYLFFEFMLLPMYFLIGIWGGARREYASIKFFLYTLLGSILILLVLIGLYISSETRTFVFTELLQPETLRFDSIFGSDGWVILGWPARSWAFLFLLIGFGIKLPMVPVHTWLPDAHVEASTPISVVLAALLLKIGGYGLLRMAYPLFPDAAVAMSSFVAFLGMLSIVYGAMNALASKDFKRLIAYSSVSHMGFILLGLASASVEGITGAVFQMTSHGLISAMLFLIAGVLYDRTGDRTIANYSGLASKMPVYTSFVLVGFFATLGLPGLSGFIGEVMVFLGAFRSELVPAWIAIVSTAGLVFGAGYCLWTIQRMFLGQYAVRENVAMHDLIFREKLMLLPLAIMILTLGIFPQTIIRYINPFSLWLVEILKS